MYQSHSKNNFLGAWALCCCDAAVLVGLGLSDRLTRGVVVRRGRAVEWREVWVERAPLDNRQPANSETPS